MVGQTLGHYKIIELLGKGGMGEVYRAEDSTLKREVALKILPADLASSQERLERFQREAETLAALNHPNIVHVYTVEEDKGTQFLTMELVKGQPLAEFIPKGGMPLERIFDIATSLADALATAHEKGVIHRDLKPANVMVTPEGRVKVLDFGLAKLRQMAEAPFSTELPTEPLTEEGRIVGTMPYMSPEQLEGKEVDARSDIFSLGVMLYEMATGERPFKGDSSASLIAAIMSHRPREVDSLRAELPHHLSRIVRHCLEKEPTKRFQSALDVRNELLDLHREESLSAAVPVAPEQGPPKTRNRWSLVAVAVAGAAIVLAVLVTLWVSRSQPPTEPPAEALAESAAAVEEAPPMIVVLPFENLGDPEDEYFADGMTEEITSRLAVVSGLRVISRTSAMQYKQNRPPMKQIGEELGVDYVLEGTVRWARTEDGSRVRITPQLIEVSDDAHLWANTYDRVVEDIFEVQSGIAHEVIAALDITLRDDEQATLDEQPTDNIVAYRAYLRGLDYKGGWSLIEADRRIVGEFEQAVELDPSFVAAWAELSRHHSFAFHGWDQTEERLSRAKAALEGAESVDPDSPQTRLARGYHYYYGYRDYERALGEFESVATTLPNDPEVLLAIAFIYRRQGSLEEAIQILEDVTALDPQDSRAWDNLAESYRATRQTAKTLTAQDRVIELRPHVNDSYVSKVGYLAELTGDLHASRAILEQFPGSSEMEVTYGWISQLYRERDWDGVIERSQTWEVDNPVVNSYRNFIIAKARIWRDGPVAARPFIEAAIQITQTELAVARESDYLRTYLSRFYAMIGDEVSALREANRAVELTAKDSFSGPRAVENLAGVHTTIGRVEDALDILESLLETDYQAAITIHMLKFEADWDPLRNHPRFQALLEKYE